MEDNKIINQEENNTEKTDAIQNNVSETSSETRHHHHHHRHSSHRHHSSSANSSRNSSKKAKKFSNFIKKNKKKLINISFVFFIVLVLVVVAVIGDMYSKNSNADNKNANKISASAEPTVEITLPYFSDDISLVNVAIEEYIKSEDIESIDAVYDKYSKAGRIDKEIPVKLSYNISSIPAGEYVTSVKIEVSENENYKNSRKYNLGNQKNYVNVYHLKRGTKYFYKVLVEFSNENTVKGEGTFKTADLPRIISIDGIANVRDFGGWKTAFGNRINQGLLYRGTEMDGAVNPKFTLTSNGISDMLTVLNIHTTMDLRSANESEGIDNPLGSKVNSKIYNAQMYSYVFNAQGKKAIKEIFSDLADKNNYPVYMHCTHGLDRTGTVCYILGALLGMNEEDLMREYKLSYFYFGWSNDHEMNAFITKLKRYDGNNISEKAENFLLSAGVTAAEIQSIKDIFLG